jgi:hypothetical protein
MKIKILKNFRYGSVSDPERMIAGNTVDMDVPEERLKKWLEMKWVELVE